MKTGRDIVIMGETDILALTSSIISVILGIIAIALSITFYKMSTDLADKTKDSAKDIQSALSKLELVFNKLYSDTFGMFRDTVSDMRRQLWSSEIDSSPVELDIESRSRDKLNMLREGLRSEVSTLAQSEGQTSEIVERLQSGIEHLLDSALIRMKTVNSEAESEVVRNHIIDALAKAQAGGRLPTFDEVLVSMPAALSAKSVLDEMSRMKSDGLINWSGVMAPDVEIRYGSKRSA